MKVASGLLIGTGLIAIAAVSFAVNGCGSSTSVATATEGISTGQSGFATRLSITGRFTMSAATYAGLKATRSTELQQMGYTLDDANRALVFTSQPLRSMFVRTGGTLLGFTDANGLVKIKALPPNASELEVINNIAETAVLKFHANQLGTLDNPTNVTIVQDANLENVVNAMDTTTRQASRGRNGCGGDCGRANTCCLDYDGGIPVATEKQCDPISASYHFLGSTCGKWFWEGVCREGMEITGDEGKCRSRHRGRFCQQIDDSDFSAKADKSKVLFGETVTIALQNNTRKNEIRAELLQNIGNLETPTPEGARSGQSVLVRHWESGSDYTWHPQRTLVYRAPNDLPGGQSSANVTVRVLGQGGPVDIPIEVCK